jgi:hypothetical protein
MAGVEVVVELLLQLVQVLQLLCLLGLGRLLATARLAMELPGQQ